MDQDERERSGADGGEAPAGRVLMEPEEPLWGNATVTAAAEPGRRWTPRHVALALVLIVVMVAVLLFLLWGVYQTAPT